MKNETRRVSWTFDSARGPSHGAHEIEGRVVRCYEEDGAVAWTRSLASSAEALSVYEGDLRAMRKNGLYTFHEEGDEETQS